MEEQKDNIVTRSRKGRLGKVRNSWGVYDCYKLIRKNHWYNLPRRLTEKEFYSIVRRVNLLLAEEIKKGNTVKFPECMGSLELRKFKAGVSFVDGQLYNTYPIDWKATNQLWATDTEARDRKILLRIENPWVYHVRYCKDNATYENKVFYQFILNRTVRQGLSENIKAGTTDTLWESENLRDKVKRFNSQ